MAPLGINEALTYKLMQFDYLILRLLFLRLVPETKDVLMMFTQFCLVLQEHRVSYIILGTNMVVIIWDTFLKVKGNLIETCNKESLSKYGLHLGNFTLYTCMQEVYKAM